MSLTVLFLLICEEASIENLFSNSLSGYKVAKFKLSDEKPLGSSEEGAAGGI